MKAVAIRLGFEFRRRWKSWLSLAIVLALFGGGLLAAAAGSRRTNSAYPRFVDKQRAFDQFFIDFSDFDPGVAKITKEQLLTLPEVEEVHTAHFFENIAPLAVFVGSDDPRFGTSFQIPKVVEGRMPAPDSIDEFAAPIGLVDELGLTVGQTMEVPFVGCPHPADVRAQAIAAEATQVGRHVRAPRRIATDRRRAPVPESFAGLPPAVLGGDPDDDDLADTTPPRRSAGVVPRQARPVQRWQGRDRFRTASR